VSVAGRRAGNAQAAHGLFSGHLPRLDEQLPGLHRRSGDLPHPPSGAPAAALAPHPPLSTKSFTHTFPLAPPRTNPTLFFFSFTSLTVKVYLKSFQSFPSSAFSSRPIK